MITFQDREPCVEDVVVHSRIHWAGESIRNMEELVAEADGVALTRFYADPTAQVDQKIQGCGTRHVQGDGFGGRNNAFVGLKERINLVTAAKVHGETKRRYRESVHGIGLKDHRGGHELARIPYRYVGPHPATVAVAESGRDEPAIRGGADQGRRDR